MPVSREDLDAALPHVMAAPKDRAAISMLCLRPGYNQRNFVEELCVTPEAGIAGDRWLDRPWLRCADGRPHPGIQISILSSRVLDLVWRNRAETPHPGDSFIVDMDLSEDNLPVGQRLKVGSAVLKVSDIFNDGCVKWKVRYGAAAKQWVDTVENHPLRLRGVLCSVETAGCFRTGDLLIKA